mgnify:CR=1 FL=1
MKIREGFILREVAGVFAAVPVEGESRQFHGMIQLNETGAFLWKKFGKRMYARAAGESANGRI